MAGPAGEEFVHALNRLAGTTNLEAAGAANAWAGTSGLELLGALNAKNHTTGLELNAVCCDLAGKPRGSLDAQGALNTL